MKAFYSFVLFSLLFACVPPPENAAVVDKRFRTTAPSTIYFKNIRSTNYSMREDAKTRIEYYQLKNLELSKTRPHLVPTIANDWMNDAAYISLKPINVSNGSILQIGEAKLELSDSLALATQTAVALRIKETLEKRQDVDLVNPSKDITTLFTSEKERANFLVVIQDYLRLTENER